MNKDHIINLNIWESIYLKFLLNNIVVLIQIQMA